MLKPRPSQRILINPVSKMENLRWGEVCVNKIEVNRDVGDTKKMYQPVKKCPRSTKQPPMLSRRQTKMWFQNFLLQKMRPRE